MNEKIEFNTIIYKGRRVTIPDKNFKAGEAVKITVEKLKIVKGE